MSTSDFAVNYSSTTGDETDVESGSMATTQNSGYIFVSFTNEESISGSGNVYTLHATVSGAVSGQNVSVSFTRDSTSSIVTGYLMSNVGYGNNLATSTEIFHIDTAVAPDATTYGNVNATGTFMWSDNSEVPHSSAVGGSAGSRDWTNDVYIEDVSQSQTLSFVILRWSDPYGLATRNLRLNGYQDPASAGSLVLAEWEYEEFCSCAAELASLGQSSLTNRISILPFLVGFLG